MAKILDPDLLNQGTEVEFLTGSLLIRLNTTGNLSTDGVSMQALYSFIKEEWKNDTNLIKYPFPMISITSEQFELVNGWDLSASFSKYLIRDGGWASKKANGDSIEEWMNITSLGTFVTGSDQAYFLQVDAGTPSNIQLTGEVNQGIQIYDSGNYDYRTFFKIYLREQGKTYGFYDLIAEQNLTSLTYRKYALPLTNASDAKISVADIGIDANSDNVADVAPYSGMSITYYTTPQTRSIGDTDYQFSIIVDGNNGTAEQIYEFVQWSLRLTVDIDAGAGTVRGDTAEELVEFVGDTLRTKGTTDGGVYIDNFQTVDTNRLQFTDDSGSLRFFPYVAAGTITFNNNLSDDSDAIYVLFFTNDDAGDNTGRDFGTQNAIVIQSNSGTAISGSVAGSSSITFDYDYDGNIQRGDASSGSDAPYTAVAIGLSSAQYVVTTGNITRTTTNIISFVAALERNYLNPA